MRGPAQDRVVMEAQSRQVEVAARMLEIQRSLAVVDTFRAEGYEPGRARRKETAWDASI
jgi:hypothetical protein